MARTYVQAESLNGPTAIFARSRWRLRLPPWALAAAVMALLSSAGLLAPGTAAGAGTGMHPAPPLVGIQISYHGACGPLTLGTFIGQNDTIATATPKLVDVTGDSSGCVGTETPGSQGTLIIGSELFKYSNVHTTTPANASVLAGQTAPFTLTVDSTSAFPLSNGDIYLGAEAMHYDTKTGSTLHITTPAVVQAAHASGSFVRLKTQLSLVGRAQPTQNSGGLGEGATSIADHFVSAQIRTPITYLTCRGRLTETKIVGGNDTVNMRSRCYTRLEPATYWPDSPYGVYPDLPSTGRPLALTPLLYHSTSSGTIDDAVTGVMTLNTEVYGLTCFPLVDGQLWIKITQVINTIAGSGTFRMFTYANDQCTIPAFTIGGSDGNNAKYAAIAPTTDTDKDGCTDVAELGTDEVSGGKRDPFNPFDFFDINHDGVVNINTDILGVASAFGTSSGPAYSVYRDRGPLVRDADRILGTPLDGDGPEPWNKSAPDHSININDDVLGVAKQFGHSCMHSHPAAGTAPTPPPFGLYLTGVHPTGLTVPIAAGQTAPFAMGVSNTAAFPSSGHVLIDGETLLYSQSAGAGGACGGSFTAATKFCVTARGVTAQHPISAAVFPAP